MSDSACATLCSNFKRLYTLQPTAQVAKLLSLGANEISSKSFILLSVFDKRLIPRSGRSVVARVVYPDGRPTPLSNW